jgi:hypothetical protein
MCVRVNGPACVLLPDISAAPPSQQLPTDGLDCQWSEAIHAAKRMTFIHPVDTGLRLARPVSFARIISRS